MSKPTEAEAANRFAQALAAFHKAQNLVVTTYRKLRGLPQEDVAKFWSGTGVRLKEHQRACATEVMAAYRVFSAEGGTAEARDRRLVSEAHQVLVGDAGEPDAKPRVDRKQRDEELQTSQRLRTAIETELERRGLVDLSEVAAALGLSIRLAERLIRRDKWLEGGVAALQAAAARLGLKV